MNALRAQSYLPHHFLPTFNVPRMLDADDERKIFLHTKYLPVSIAHALLFWGMIQRFGRS